jgi:hypothetical protein
MARQLTISEIATPAPEEDFQSAATSTFDQWVASARRLQELRQREETLFTRLNHPSPNDLQPKGVMRRPYHQLFEKLINWLSGRDHALLTELDAFRVEHMVTDYALLTELNAINIEHMAALELRIEQATEIDQHRRAEERLRLLELLTDYEYR